MSRDYQIWEIRAHPGINGVYISHVRRPKRKWQLHTEAPRYVRDFLNLTGTSGKVGDTADLAALERYNSVVCLEKSPQPYHNRYRVKVWMPPDIRPPRTRLHLAHISRDFTTFADLGRAVYKYTDCGPWIVAVLLDGSEVYYTSPEAHALSMDTVVRAIRVGSIVEGSDADVGPYEVTRARDFWPTVERVNEEAVIEWHDANDDPDIDPDFSLLPTEVTE